MTDNLECTTHGGRPGAPIATDEPRPLHVIADDIRRTWRNKSGAPCVNYAAVPYLDAMRQLGSISESYGYDPADHIVRYFLSNARSWRGEDARRIKAELKALL